MALLFFLAARIRYRLLSCPVLSCPVPFHHRFRGGKPPPGRRGIHRRMDVDLVPALVFRIV
jgi:hypothetical protein